MRKGQHSEFNFSGTGEGDFLACKLKSDSLLTALYQTKQCLSVCSLHTLVLALHEVNLDKTATKKRTQPQWKTKKKLSQDK